MSCEEIRDRLSDYLDGELPQAERDRVAEHLRTCVPCRGLYRDLESLVERARGIDPAVSPRRDLWPGVAERIGGSSDPATTAPRRGRFASRWIAAAAAVLVVGLLAPAVVERLAPPTPQMTSQRQIDRMSYEALVAEAEVARVEDGVLQPRLDMAELIATRSDVLDQETVATFRAEAARLERAIGEIHVALAEQPDSAQLKHLLAARYRQERDLLQRISRV